jgi:hypothetical protein
MRVDGESRKRTKWTGKETDSGKGVKNTVVQRGEGEESEWKRKLRIKLAKGKGNEEVLRGSIMGDDLDLEVEESEWKRKLRDKLKKGVGNDMILNGSFLREVGK